MATLSAEHPAPGCRRRAWLLPFTLLALAACTSPGGGTRPSAPEVTASTTRPAPPAAPGLSGPTSRPAPATAAPGPEAAVPPSTSRAVQPRIETGQHTGLINALASDRDNRWLVTASHDKTARIWDLQSGRLDQILRPPSGEGEQGRLLAAAITPDGKVVALGGVTGDGVAAAAGGSEHPVYLFDRATGRLIGRSAGLAHPTRQLVMSADGKRLAVVLAGGGSVRVLDLANLQRELLRDDDCPLQTQSADFDRRGRLVTSCSDGLLRLFDAQGRRIGKRKVDGGSQPSSVRFSPDGTRVAVGFFDSPAVVVVSGGNLAPLFVARSPGPSGVTTGSNLHVVAWSRDGQTLHAGGRYMRAGGMPVVAWPLGGRGAPKVLAAAADSVQALLPLANGRLAFADADPAWGMLERSGQIARVVLPASLDHRGSVSRMLRMSADARRVEFSFDTWNGHERTRGRAQFDLATRTLDTAPAPSTHLKPARHEGLPLSDWTESTLLKLNGQPLPGMQAGDIVRSLSVAANNGGFVTGTSRWLHSFDASGRPRWRQPLPGVPWGLNQSDDGRWVVAALSDGTLRWYDGSNGRERLALFVHGRDRRWVLFAPEGFYQASPGGDTLLGYHLNQGADREGAFIDATQLSGVYFRPDLITRRLAGDETALSQALKGIAQETPVGGLALLGQALQSLGDVGSVLSGGLPPKVSLLSPLVASSDGDYDLRVKIEPARAGDTVGALRLFINGAEVRSRAISPPGGGVVTQRLSLAPGLNTVSLRAMRADGKVASNEVMVRVNVAPAQTQPTLRVLAVGISQYDDASFKGGVRFAARDAEAVVDRLRSGGIGVYREVDARLLNRRADTGFERIEAELQALVKRARPEDVVVIFLAGHGKAPDGQYHFIPADFVYDSDQAFTRGRTLSHARIEDMLRQLGAGKRLLILDTCDSGSTVQGRDGATDQKDAVARLIRSSGRYILAAAPPMGKALEDGVRGHGVYTSALLEGLAGAADPRNTGMIEVDALAEYVARRVPQLTAPAGYEQRPMRSAQGENFPIVRRTGKP